MDSEIDRKELKEGIEPSNYKYESYGLPLAYFSFRFFFFRFRLKFKVKVKV